MDVDEDEDATQAPKRVQDYGIEVDFDGLDEEDKEADVNERIAELDASITKLNADIERMAPNMKAMERYAISCCLCNVVFNTPHRLDDVEAKLLETEKEADKARKDSKTARDQFNDVKRRR